MTVIAMTNDRRLSPADWEARLNASRDRRFVVPNHARIDQCRALFRDISARTRRHRQSSWLLRPEYEPLRRASDETLLLSRLASRELARFEPIDVPTVPLELLEQLLRDNAARLEAVDDQLQLIRSTVSLAESLRPLVEGILSADGFPARRLDALLDQLGAEPFAKTPQKLVPWPGLSLERILAADNWRHAWFFADALHNARWTAALRGRSSAGDSHADRFLIAAALLADLGLLVPAISRKNSGAESLPPRVFRQHPDVSAAIIAGMNGASHVWALLASQHHERLDGSGFPLRLADRQLSPAARELTAALRWAELLRHSSVAVLPDEALVVAADALWRETQRGGFDPAIVRRMFDAVHPDLAAAVCADELDRASGLLDPAHPRTAPNFRTLAPHEDVQPSVAPPSQRYLRHVRQQARRFQRSHRTPLRTSAEAGQ